MLQQIRPEGNAPGTHAWSKTLRAAGTQTRGQGRHHPCPGTTLRTRVEINFPCLSIYDLIAA